MIYLQVFLVGAIFSFLGSVPPGTLNVCVLQLGLEKKIGTALRFALAVSIIEYPYTWIGVKFEHWITSTPAIVENFQLITAVVMTIIGVINIWSAQKPTEFTTKFNESGFRRGLVLSILNPMAIPFWIAITAYLKAQGWIDLSSTSKLHLYVFGTSVGAMALLTTYTYLAHRLSGYVTGSKLVKLIPGITLLALGLYAFVRYLL
jgi:threonine/homoserine/homoserine lactone efflux protein